VSGPGAAHDLVAIFNEALDQPSASARAAYLDRVCGTDLELRVRVETLLAAYGRVGGFLEQPASSPSVSVEQPRVAEGAGTVIGPYKLLQLIGEGGMGTVWMAEQTKPVKRVVALKVIKAGMDSRQVLARFDAERQALALMDHPNIAKVLDASATEQGRPYFVMELVRGVPITSYCDQKRLTPRERLELFIPVCQALQHAHQKGITHRDLKPSNVLVGLYDGKPVSKVIDFGVAKAAGHALTEKTLFTGFGTVIGTPEYMSPEQAQLDNLDIDTRSDIYSLGVLLYELLTGTTPFTKKDLEKAGMLEMLRVIREQEPTKPSTKLSTAEGLPTLAANRGMEPAKLMKLVRGELDWIVMKALEKDRNRRYETANAFAMDLDRYLADEPVDAGPPSAWYRFRKFARRNSAGLAILAAIVLVLMLAVAGLALNNWMVTREKEKKQAALERAVREKARADQNLDRARKAVRDYLTAAANNRLLKEADFSNLRRELLESALGYYEEFVKQKSDDPELERERGRAYGDLAMVREDLGDLESALNNHEQRRAVFENLVARYPTNPVYRQELANSYRNAGNVHIWRNQYDKAETALRRAMKLLEDLLAEYPTSAPYRQDLAGAYSNLAVLLRNSGRLEHALGLHQKAQDLRKQLSAEFRQIPEHKRDLAQNYGNMATTFGALGRHDDALKSIQESEILFQKLTEEFSTRQEFRDFWATALNNKSVLLWELGRRSEGLAAQKQALRLQEKLAADFPSLPGYDQDVAMSHTNMGLLLGELNRSDEALESYDKALDILDRVIQRSPNPQARQAQALTYVNRGEALRRLNRNQEAVDATKRAVNIQVKLVAESPAMPRLRKDLGMSYGNLGELLTLLGRYDEADASYKDAIAIREKLAQDSASDPSYAVDLSGSYAGMGTLVQERGRPEAALVWYAKALAGLEPVLAAEPRLATARRFAATIHGGRALALGKLARHVEALPDLDKALTFDDGQRREALRLKRAETLARLGRHAQATAEANALAQAENATADTRYEAACVLALAATAARDRAPLAEQYAARAVALLRQAFEQDPKAVRDMPKDTRLDPLRSRENFRKLTLDWKERQPEKGNKQQEPRRRPS
jgi:serine/threonine protein kinase